MSVRDINVLQHMLNWCEQVSEAHMQYDHSRSRFDTVSAYRNAIAMCLFQICELTNHLSEQFRTEHPEMPWKQIRGMRNLFANDYGNMDVDSIWETACNDIPVIEVFCRKQIAEARNQENDITAG